jgi:long-chain acyl-CoA synthetase
VTTVGQWLLEGKAGSRADALVSEKASVRYAELVGAAREIREAVESTRIERPVIAVFAEASLTSVTAYVGALSCEAVVAPLPAGSDEALAGAWNALQPDIVFADDAGWSRLKTLALGGAARLRSNWSLEAADSSGVRREPLGPDVCVLEHTSGSSGRPRAVMVSRRNLLANTQACVDFVALTAADRAYLAMPVAYCYGASVLHAHLRAGASVVLGGLAFPEVALDLIETQGVTGLPGVPGTFEVLLQRSTLRQRQLKALRYVTISGGRLPDPSLAALVAALPRARVVVRYGITEATALASYLPPERATEKVGSIGRGLPGAPLSQDPVTGEIVVRGEHVTLGYFGDPEETAKHFRGGAYYTGDLAEVDADGDFFIVGREREFIKSMGYRIAPQEVEAVIAAAPRVAAAAVFGVPDPLRGEALVALVVARSGESVPLEEVERYCAQRLPVWMVPSEWYLVPCLPTNASGKVARRSLKRP